MKNVLSVAVVLSVSALSQISAASFVSNPGAGAANTAPGFIVKDSLSTRWTSDADYAVTTLGLYMPAGLTPGETVTVSLWPAGASFDSSAAALGAVTFTSADSGADAYGYVYKSVPSISLTSASNYGLTARGWTLSSIDNSGFGGPVPSYILNTFVGDTYNGPTIGNPYAGGAGVGYTVLAGAPVLSMASFQATAVPEPETYAMLAGLGLVGFGLYRRCRN